MISRIFTFLGLTAVLTHAQSKPEGIYATTPVMQNEARATVALIERYHISKKTLAEIDANEVIRTFCETLDPAKLYFTQAEVDGFVSRYGKSLDLYLVRGNLTPAFEIYSVFKDHVAERTQWAVVALSQKIDLNQSGTFPLDRQKGNWSADAKEADDLWNRRVRLDMLAELLGEDRASTKKKEGKNESVQEKNNPEINEAKIAEAVEKLRKRYEKTRTYLDFEPQEIEEFFLTSFSAQFDPHSTFFSQRTLEEFEIGMRNTLCGIGATLTDEEGYCTVKEILPGGPLELSGKVKSGDRIIAVGQGEKGEMEDIVGLRLTKTISRIRGQQGTIVRLLIDPADNSGRFTINLTRDQIKLVNQMASARCIEVPSPQGIIKLGVIELPAFYGKNPDGTGSSPSKDVEELIHKLKKLEIKALVIDLRKNGGGLLSEAVDVSGLFIKKGSVLQVRNSLGRVEDYRDEDAKVAWDGPLIVLTSKLSASASEILCGALKDHRRALIVGDTTTHGKGSVQNIIELKNAFKNFDPKSAVKITIQKWYAPSGSSIQLKGVPADIIVPSVYSVLPVAESDLERPLAWDSIPPSLPKSDDEDSLSFKISPELVQNLKAASEKRQAELPEFLTLNRTIEWTKNRQGRKEISLSLPQRRQERKDDLAFREQVRAELDKFSAQKFKSTEIKLDTVAEQEKLEGADKAAKLKRASRFRDPIEDEDWPDYDIQLMESLRIATDWAKLKETAKATSATQPLSSSR